MDIQIKTAWLFDERIENWDGYIRTMGYILEQMLPTMCVGLMFLCRHRLSGMDMTLCDYDGRTALHLAAAEGHLECVAFLLEHCNVPHNPKDRSVPSQFARSPLNMEHCNVAHYPKDRSVPSKTARSLLSPLNMEHCNVAHLFVCLFVCLLYIQSIHTWSKPQDIEFVIINYIR